MTDTPTECRIAHKWGAGPWRPIADRELLAAWVKDGNARYGAGSHWLEVR